MNSGMGCWKKTYWNYILLLVFFYSWSLNLWMWILLDIYRLIPLLVFLFLDILYYISDLSSFLILTQCALIYWCLIIFFTLSAQDSVLNEHLIMIMFITIFTINLTYNDILFCLFKISFVCWQRFLNRHYLKFK